MILDYYDLVILLTEGVYDTDLQANPRNLGSRKKRRLVEQLIALQEFMRNNKLARKGKQKTATCHFNRSHVVQDTHVYTLDDIVWTGQLLHYIEFHNYAPDPPFEKMLASIRYHDTGILTYHVPMEDVLALYQKRRTELDGIVLRQGKRERIVITQDQLRLLDSLFLFSSEKMLNDKDYEEAMAYLDFQHKSLEHIKVKINRKYMFKAEDQFLFFHNINEKDAIDYEFLVHTHPLTPDLETRIEVDSIMFDFPSATDVITFIEMASKHQMQGSIVIAIEGVYVIRRLRDLSVVLLDKNEFQWEYNMRVYHLNERAIDAHYDERFSLDLFLSKIIGRREYIDELNEFLRDYNMTIDYHPRVRKNKRFVLPAFAVSVVPIELEVLR